VSRQTSATCREVLGRISAYLDGDLPAPACHEIDQHCRNCAECAALVDGLRRTLGLCQEAGKAPLPESILSRARESVRRLLAAKAPRSI
jgi:anti-sigma factor RsiW